MDTASRPTGRFAPSPTGPLHLGSLVAAVGSFLSARSKGGRWIVRMEDLDTPRVVAGSAGEILEALRRYGLEWDGEVVFQSERHTLYRDALVQLRNAGAVFDCACSRAELQRAASAPAASDPQPAIYPGTCRDGLPPGRQPRAVRFRVPHRTIEFHDAVMGDQSEDLDAQTGDFVVKRADGVFAYQLAVVVDDAEQGVTEVVRGADLIGSTARQIALQEELGYPTPVYAHLPLVVNADGSKIGKRDAALPLPALDLPQILRTLRLALHVAGLDDLPGESPERILENALDRFSLARIPREPFIVA